MIFKSLVNNETSGKQTADIATVKVNLIKVSIAGWGGFVKADYIIEHAPFVPRSVGL